MERYELERLALADFAKAQGNLFNVDWVYGYVGDDSHDVRCDPPAVVRIDPTGQDSILHWCDEWLDPYWDVTILDSVGQPLENGTLAGLRSTWIHGPSYNLKTGERDAAGLTEVIL